MGFTEDFSDYLVSLYSIDNMVDNVPIRGNALRIL